MTRPHRRLIASCPLDPPWSGRTGAASSRPGEIGRQIRDRAPEVPPVNLPVSRQATFIDGDTLFKIHRSDRCVLKPIAEATSYSFHDRVLRRT